MLLLLLIGSSCQSSNSSDADLRIETVTSSGFLSLDRVPLDQIDLDDAVKIRTEGPCGSTIPVTDMEAIGGTQGVDLEIGRSLVIVQARMAETPDYAEAITSDLGDGCSYEDEGVMGPVSIAIKPLTLQRVADTDAVVGWESTIEQSATITYQYSVVVSRDDSLLFLDMASTESIDREMLMVILAAVKSE